MEMDLVQFQLRTSVSGGFMDATLARSAEVYRSRAQARFKQVRIGGSGYVHIVILLGKATL